MNIFSITTRRKIEIDTKIPFKPSEEKVCLSKKSKDPQNQTLETTTTQEEHR